MKPSPRSTRDLPNSASPEDVEAYLTSLVARRVFGEDPARLTREVDDERQADEVEALQTKSGRPAPEAPSPGPELNRRMRRARGRQRRLARVIAAMIERARAEGSDPNWRPEAFPALDWRIKSEATSIMRDVTGRKARIFCSALPPSQGELLVEEARRLAPGDELDAGFALPRWRELVAGAWVSWRLSRPVRRRRKPATSPTSRENPWAGGRVVDGYARQAFCLLMRDLRTGAPMSISKLFYRNGSGEQGVFGYLARPAPATPRRGLPRIDGVLGLYTRFQPRADRSRYVGPPKKGADGRPLLGPSGQVQRYALSEHWYHRDRCGRRAVVQADRGNRDACSLLRLLCPWLFGHEERLADLAPPFEPSSNDHVPAAPPSRDDHRVDGRHEAPD